MDRSQEKCFRHDCGHVQPQWMVKMKTGMLNLHAPSLLEANSICKLLNSRFTTCTTCKLLFYSCNLQNKYATND